MHWPALSPRGRRSIAALGAVAAVAVVTIAVLARRGDDDTIVDHAPVDPPATERDPHIVASIQAGGGMTDVPEGSGLVFELQDDGSVFVAGDGAAGVDRYRLTPAGVERARDLLAGIDLGDEDYGEPTITDMPTTTVYLSLDAASGAATEPADLSVYALTDLDAFSEAGDLGLSAGQQASRGELLGILDQLTGLADDAALVDEPPAAYVPERMDVTFVPWVSDADTTGGTSLDVRSWPLTAPLTDRTLGWDGLRLCATVEGDELGTLTAAMAVERAGPQEIPWSTGAAEGSGRPVAVAVQAWGLRPGQPACEDRPAASPEPGEPLQVDAGPLTSVELPDPEGPDGWDGALAADSFRRAEPLELYAVVPTLAAAVAADPATALSSTDLTWYEYRAVVAVVDGTNYVDIEALPFAGSTPDAGGPATWRARTDPATGEVVTIEAD